MTIGISYLTSNAFWRAAMDSTIFDILEAIPGHNIELFGHGQSPVREPVGGHPKHLHLDSAFFEYRFEGPVGILTYVVETGHSNGALHGVQGSRGQGQFGRVDQFSLLGLDGDEWSWEDALSIVDQEGDSIFFHVRTVHGSKQNSSDGLRPVFSNRCRRPDECVVFRATTAASRAEAEKHVQDAYLEDDPHRLMVCGYRPFSDSDEAGADGAQ